MFYHFNCLDQSFFNKKSLNKYSFVYLIEYISYSENNKRLDQHITKRDKIENEEIKHINQISKK